MPDIGRMTTLKDMSATKKQVVSQLEIIGEIDAGVPATIIRFFVAKIGLGFVKIFRVCPGTFMSADAVIKVSYHKRTFATSHRGGCKARQTPKI